MTTQNAPENSFSLTLFDIYRKKDPKGPLPEPPTFTWTDRNGASQQIPFLQPVQITKEEGGEKSVRSALHRLYPLAQDIFRDRYVFRAVPNELLAELKDTKNGTWKVDSAKLPVCFSRAGGFCLEEKYLLLYVEVQLVMPGLDAESLAQQAVMLTNKLCYREKQAQKLVRKFNAQQEESKGRSAQEVVRDHFQGNDSSALIKGLNGEPVTIPQMFADLAGPAWESMLLDRFLLNSLLITPVDEEVPVHSQAEQENLIRLARGINEQYLPAPLDVLAGYVIPVRTFANVLFLAANEGVAGHIKTAPQQNFLAKQFPERYRTEYMLFFVLAIYQHYRLIDLFGELKELDGNGQHLERLRQLRRDLALHEVKYVNTKPAFLTNYQQYYTALRQGLNTAALEEKLRRSVAELDALVDAEEQSRTEEYQQERKRQEEQETKRTEFLAFIVEIVAMPYYLLNLLEHTHLFSAHCAGALTLIATVGVVVLTRLRFRQPKKTV